MDIVLPFKADLLSNNIELVYSLRSVERFCTGYNDLILIGDLPKWYKGGYISFAENSRVLVNRDKRILDKFIVGVNVFGTVVGWNDDYYVGRDLDLSNLPYYYREEDMKTTIDRQRGGWKGIRNTREYLLNKGKKTKMFDGHCPIIYEKEKMQKVLEADWSIDYGYGIKSLYANLNDIEGDYLPDTKIMEGLPEIIVKNTIKSSFIVSSSTRINKYLLKYLQNEFPHKSKWEK